MTNTITPCTVRSADGTTIAYERTGSGPAVVLVDPAGHFRGYGPMRELAARLAGELTVYCYDRRGRGESGDAPAYAVEREVDDLRALIEVAGGSASVHGFSSGAVLALHAAAAGVPIPRLVLLEPPLELGEPEQPERPEQPEQPERPAQPPDGDAPDLAAEVAELLAAGRRGEAYLHVNRSIGVPEEMLAGIEKDPAWPQLRALAHTFLYDLEITATLTADRVGSIGTPGLVVNSAGTDERLLAWGRGVADALPRGSHRTLPGEWHGVSADVLAPVLADFVGGAAN